MRRRRWSRNGWRQSSRIRCDHGRGDDGADRHRDGRRGDHRHDRDGDDVGDDVNVDNDDATEEEETFYDALEYLTSKKEDVAVEDVSDLEDDELRELQSTKRNLIPSHGEWMEPLEPDGISYSTFSPEKDSKPKQESYKLFGIGIPFSTYESKEEP